MFHSNTYVFFRTYSILLLLVVFSGITSAQQLDSLFKQFPLQKEDTLKAHLLVKIIDAAAYNNPSIMGQYADSLLALSQRIKYEPGIISGYLYLAQSHYIKQDWELMKQYLSKAQELYQKNGDLDGIYNIKLIYSNYYNSIGEKEKSLQQNFEILKHFEKKKDNRTAVLQGRIAYTLSTMERYAEAETYYLKSLKTKKAANDKRGISVTLVNLGAMCNDWEKFDKAAMYLNECLALQKELKDSVIISACESNLANIYNSQKKYNQSLLLSEKNLKYHQSKNDTDNMVIILISRSSSFAGLNDQASALAQLASAEKLLENSSNYPLKADVYHQYYQLYKLARNHELALLYLEKEKLMNQESDASQFNDKISELKEKYETELKEQENIALKNDNQIKSLTLKNQLNTIYAIAVTLLMVIGISVLLVRINRVKAKEKNIQLQQKLFISQMNPHFIFNSLNAIQNYIYKQDSLQASTYLSQFAELIRMILNHSRKNNITLDEEIKLLKNYLELQQLRFANKFTYDIIVDEELETEFVEIPPMLAQPFVENSLEHGLFRNNEPGKISIRFKKDGDSLKVEIEDNGIGIQQSLKSKPDAKEHESLATFIAKDRIRNINSQKGKKSASFEIIDLASVDGSLHGVKVIFTLGHIS